MLGNVLSLLLFTPTSETTCATSYGTFLVSLSPAVCALLSATALWVGAHARRISKDALQTSQAVVSLSLLDSPSPLAMGDQEAAPGPEKP